MTSEELNAIRDGRKAEVELQTVQAILEEIKAAAIKAIMAPKSPPELNTERMIVTYQVAEKILNSLEAIIATGEGYQAIQILENE